MPNAHRARTLLDAVGLLAVVRAAAGLIVVDVALRLAGFHRVRRWLQGRGKGPAAPVTDVDLVVEQACLAVDRARRYHLYPMRCLTRSLVLQWLLARRGVPTTLRIGVRKESGNLSAHAWIERNGRPVGEAETLSQRFVPLVSAEVRR